MGQQPNSDGASGARPRFRWTLGRKIVGLGGLLLVLLIAVAGYSLLQLRSVGREIEKITEGDLKISRSVSDISRRVSERLKISAVTRMGVIAPPPDMLVIHDSGKTFSDALDYAARIKGATGTDGRPLFFDTEVEEAVVSGSSVNFKIVAMLIPPLLAEHEAVISPSSRVEHVVGAKRWSRLSEQRCPV